MIRLSGIFRSVYLYSTPAVHLRDFKLDTPLNDTYTDAELAVTASVRAYGDGGDAGKYTVETQLYDARGHAVWSRPLNQSADLGTVGAGQDVTVRATKAVPRPRLWSAEHPDLYTAVLRLRDPAGKVVETLSHRVGFREFALKDGLMRINGRPVSFRGTNRHEMHPDRGTALTRDDLVEDIEIIKRMNMNSVRTSHYPNNPLWYELADEYGLYLVDETNLETHGIREEVSRRPPRLDRGLRGPRPEHGAPRQEPRLGRHLVARQRGGRRQHLHRHARLDPLLRPPPASSSTRATTGRASATSAPRCTTPRSASSSGRRTPRTPGRT